MSQTTFVPVSNPEPEDTKRVSRRKPLRLRQGIEDFCYWLTMVGLAIATIYLAYLTVRHAEPPDPSELGWCATTPKWLVDCFPLFITGICLGEAGHAFSKGIRSWKRILAGAGLLLLRALPQWLPALSVFTHR